MRFLTRLAVLFYFTFLLFVCLAVLVFVLNSLDFYFIAQVLHVVYYDEQLRLITGIVTLIILLMNFLFAQMISEKEEKERTIAFDNPAGRVTVSLMVLEDMIKKLAGRSPEIKEIKPVITASKKGLKIYATLILKTDVNIPDLTIRLQDMIKRKIQEAVGIEEEVSVKIHVSKIVLDAPKGQRKDDKDDLETIPFQGYRA